MIAQRARERNVFSEATWADILNPEGPYVVPPDSLRAFSATTPMISPTNIKQHGNPIHVSLRAGSRRLPPRYHAPVKPAFIPQVFRHIVFLALLQQAVGDLSVAQSHDVNTDWHALTASHLMATDFTVP